MTVNVGEAAEERRRNGVGGKYSEIPTGAFVPRHRSWQTSGRTMNSRRRNPDRHRFLREYHSQNRHAIRHGERFQARRKMRSVGDLSGHTRQQPCSAARSYCRSRRAVPAVPWVRRASAFPRHQARAAREQRHAPEKRVEPILPRRSRSAPACGRFSCRRSASPSIAPCR